MDNVSKRSRVRVSDGKQYLGDGVFVDVNAGHVVLTTEDGINVTNRIILEPSVLARLVAFGRGVLDAPPEGENE